MKRRCFKVRFWLGLAIAPIVLGVPTTAQASINVVPNPGFEQAGCNAGRVTSICAWRSGDDTRMSQDRETPHSGAAGLWLSFICREPTGCEDAGVEAMTEPAFCASIGPGTHPASLWYLPLGGGPIILVWASFRATFYQAPNCTGPASIDSITEVASWDETWQMLKGELLAPTGTESALFAVYQWAWCADYCGLMGEFDDVYVGDAS
jgi:hypothetical protein